MRARRRSRLGPLAEREVTPWYRWFPRTRKPASYDGIVAGNTLLHLGNANGHTLLIVPGAFTTWHAMQPVLDGLRDFRLFVASLPGHDPERAGDFTTVSEIADEIAAQVPEGHVDYGLGFSVGGMILADIVSRRLVTVDRVILDSPSTPRSALLGWVMRRLMAVEVRNRLAGRTPRLPVLPPSARLYTGLSPVSIEAVLRESFSHHLPAGGLPPEVAVEAWYGQKEMAIHGTASFRNLTRTTPQATARIFPGCSHGTLMFEQPARYAEAAKTFFAQ